MKKFNSISLWIEKICDKIIAKFLFKSQSFSSNSKKSPKILSQKNIIRAQLRKLNWCNKNKAMKREKLITSSGEFAINYFWVLLTQKKFASSISDFQFQHWSFFDDISYMNNVVGRWDFSLWIIFTFKCRNMIEGDFDKSEQYFRLNMRKFDNLRLSKLVLTNCKSYFTVGCKFLLFSKF